MSSRSDTVDGGAAISVSIQSDRFSRLARRFDRMLPDDRVYALNSVPVHLDKAGDESSAKRLIRLASDGFAQIKADRTLDAPLSSLDYAYFFRATLRAGDLASALELARTRSGLSHLTDWLGSGLLAELLPHLGADSRLWEQIRRAVASLQPETLRVERYTEFHQPDLDPAIYSWLRDQFDRDGALARDGAQRDFLAAVAAHERGAISYILQRVHRSGYDARLAREVTKNLQALCDGSGITSAEAWAEIAPALRHHSEAFVAAADVLAAMEDNAAAIEGLHALEPALPEPEQSPEPLMCAAALSHAWAAKHQPRRAAETAAKSLRSIPPVLSDESLKILYATRYVEAAGRLALAAAPFPEQWLDAAREAEQLAARAPGFADRAVALSGFVRVLPWIGDSAQRTAWFNKVLAEMREFSQQSFPEDPQDPGDIAIELDAERHGKNRTNEVLQPMIAGLLDTIRQTDRILISDEDFQPLTDLILTAAAITKRLEDDHDDIIDFAGRMLAATTECSNPGVQIMGILTFFDITSKYPDAEAAANLAGPLAKLVSGKDEGTAYGIAMEILERAEENWCQTAGEHEIDIYVALTDAVLKAAIGARQFPLVDVWESHLPAWITRADESQQEFVAVRWATALLRLGLPEKAREVLSILRNPDLDTRLAMSRILADVGCGGEATELIANDLAADVDLHDSRQMEQQLNLAATLVRASGHSAAREMLFTNARIHRESIANANSEQQAVLLDAFSDINDMQLLRRLVAEAERELVESTQTDSTMAAHWYVALALNGMGAINAAKRVRSQLRPWKEQKRMDDVRSGLLELLETGGVRELKRTIAALGNEENREAALLHICRATPKVQSDAHPAIIDIILENLRMLDAGAQNVVIDAFSNAVNAFAADSCVARAVDEILSIIEKRPQPKATYDFESALRAVIRLMRVHPSTDLLERLMRRLARPNASASEAELFQSVLAIGGDRRLGLKLCREVEDPLGRSRFLRAVAEAPVDAGEKSVIDEAAESLISQFDTAEAQHSALFVELCGLYKRIWIQLSPPIVEVFDERIRSFEWSARPPLMEAASELTGTPLQQVCDAGLQALWDELDKFAEHPLAINYFPMFLEAELALGIRSARVQYTRVINWAASMPMVRNEDIRHQVFSEILKVSSDIVGEDRRAVQELALDKALDVLHGWVFDQFMENLPKYPIDADLAASTISKWLDRTRNKQPAPGIPEIDRLVSLMIASLRHQGRGASPGVLDAFVRLLDKSPGVPSTLKHSDAARVYVECSHPAMRSRVRELLMRHYEREGLTRLDEWDLAFLSEMPFSWWVDHSTEVVLERDDRRLIVDWIDRMLQRDSDTAWWCTILACDWLSRSYPAELPDLWFELSTLPSFPEHTRADLLRAMRSSPASRGAA